MRWELLVWLKDCIESIDEFEGILSSSPERNDPLCDNGEDRQQGRRVVVCVSVNVMKCPKNVLNLVLVACKCVASWH